jgi:hypothetical protein
MKRSIVEGLSLYIIVFIIFLFFASLFYFVSNQINNNKIPSLQTPTISSGVTCLITSDPRVDAYYTDIKDKYRILSLTPATYDDLKPCSKVIVFDTSKDILKNIVKYNKPALIIGVQNVDTYNEILHFLNIAIVEDLINNFTYSDYKANCADFSLINVQCDNNKWNILEGNYNNQIKLSKEGYNVVEFYLLPETIYNNVKINGKSYFLSLNGWNYTIPYSGTINFQFKYKDVVDYYVKLIKAGYINTSESLRLSLFKDFYYIDTNASFYSLRPHDKDIPYINTLAYLEEDNIKQPFLINLGNVYFVPLKVDYFSLDNYLKGQWIKKLSINFILYS